MPRFTTPGESSQMATPMDRSPAQFFFEVGFGACWAEMLIRNDSKPPFPLTDAVVEHAWQIAGEAHEDPAEFDRYLAAANIGSDSDASVDQLLIDFYTSAHFDPKATRNADTVKAAIAFTLSRARGES